jgi:peptide/nickel transport system ATP-binding protein
VSRSTTVYPPAEPSAEQVDQTPLLVVDGLTVAYANASDKAGPPVLAVADVSLTVGRGERVAIVGESGSGKTTLALAIAGFLNRDGVQITSRKLEFEGAALQTDTKNPLPTRIPGLTMMFQDAMTSLDPVWRVESQLKAVLRNTEKLNRKELADRTRYWLGRVGLTDTERVLHARPYELSGGMRQRVMLALALCGRPRLLIADEPTSALDASLSRDMMELLLELTQQFGTSLLIVSHDIHLCQEYSDRTVVMLDGHAVEQGPSATLERVARHSYTVGLMRCVPTLDNAFADELPTLASVAYEVERTVVGANA